jgi:all-trans-retinol 13,14-reductase
MSAVAQAWDAIVIGSGIGGMAAAAALATTGRRVLVLERHSRPGGLTQTFERDGFRFNVGVHYLGAFGPGQDNQRLFDRLAGGRLRMAPIDGAYDRFRFPGFEFAFTPPAHSLRAALAAEFPREAEGIARYFDAVDDAARTMPAVFAARCAPIAVAMPLTWLKQASIRRWVARTTWDVVRECVRDERLRALLCAQWGDYGSRPAEGSFAVHALVMRHYLDGAWYPVGGSAGFAQELGRTVTEAGGAVRTQAEVAAIRVAEGRAAGVTLASGERIDCPCVISDVGIHNTLRLLPAAEVDYQWASDALQLQPSVGHVGLYLGLEGDIAAAGADSANNWIFESWDVNALWRDPMSEVETPAMFVSFPTLRDPAHDPGTRQRHTCEIVALVDWSVFAQWDRSDAPGGMKAGTPSAARNESYAAFKDLIERNLFAQFARHFPALAPLVRSRTASTPISVASFTGAEHGAMYGLQTTPERVLSDALRPRSPIGGLFLAGQDVGTPGVTGAAMGGLMAAASVEPRLWSLIRG